MTEPEDFIRDFFSVTGYRPEAISSEPSGERAPLYKTYPDVPTVKLQPPPLTRTSEIFETIAARRSVRVFSKEPLSVSEISQLARAAQGITGRHGDREIRAAPSAGAQYPVETYLAVNRSEEIEAGVYHLNVRDFALERLSEGSPGAALAGACLGQRFVATCPVAFIWTGIHRRLMWRYGKRGVRYIFMDAGHIGENVHLAATAMGLGCCGVGAFYDDRVAALLGLHGTNEFPLYLYAVGRTREESG